MLQSFGWLAEFCHLQNSAILPMAGYSADGGMSCSPAGGGFTGVYIKGSNGCPGVVLLKFLSCLVWIFGGLATFKVRIGRGPLFDFVICLTCVEDFLQLFYCWSELFTIESLLLIYIWVSIEVIDAWWLNFVFCICLFVDLEKYFDTVYGYYLVFNFNSLWLILTFSDSVQY